MSVEFRCENCGRLMSVEAGSGPTATCPHCHKVTTVPAALASLPHPHVPANAVPAAEPAPAVRPTPTRRAAAVREVAPEPTLGLMARLMPVVISLFFHLGVVMVCMFLSMAVVRKGAVPIEVYSADMDQVTPVNRMTPQRSTGGGKVGAKNVTRETVAPTKKSTQSLIGRESPSAAASDFSMSGLGSSSANPGQTLGSGGSGGKGPPSGFIGVRVSAHHVCYVIDASGSMIDSFPAVRNEMLESIRKLQEIHDFDAIIINGAPGQYLENAPKTLVPASSGNKEAVAAFLDGIQASSRGTGAGKSQAGSTETEAAPALARAFDVLDKANSLPGKVLFLLTDGAFDDNDKILAVVAARNKKKEVMINTFLYGHEQESAKVFMERLAKDNNGKYKYVTEDE